VQKVIVHSNVLKPEILTKLRARTSASQISAFLQCQRRWHIGWVLDEKTPPGPPLLTGTDIHAVVEPYLITGKLPEAKDIKVTSPGRTAEEYLERVKPAIPYLPPAGSDSVEVEQEIGLETYHGGPELYGRFDAIDHTRKATPTDPRELRMVYDCKTSSDFKYAKTPEQLANDVQLGGYAMHELELYPQDDYIRLRHVYIRTKGSPKALPVDVVVSREQVEDRHARTVDIVRDMQKVIAPGKEVTDPNDLPPTLESCGLYGGCPHRARCGLSATTSLVNLFAPKKTESNKIETKKTESKENVPMSSLLERLKAKGALPAPTNGVTHAATPAATPATATVTPIGAAAAAIVPPDAPSRTNDPVTSTAVEQTSAEAEKPKRTRRTKAEIEAAKAAEAAASTGRDPAIDRAAFDEAERRAQPSNISIAGKKLTIGELEDIAAQDAAHTSSADQHTCKVCNGVFGPMEKSVLKNGTIVHVGCPGQTADQPTRQIELDEPTTPTTTAQPTRQIELDESTTPAKKSSLVERLKGNTSAPEPAVTVPETDKRPEATKAPAAAATTQTRPTLATEVAKAPASQTRPTLATEAQTAPTSAPAAQTRPTLYIDCIPTKGAHAGKVVMYEDWLAPLLSHICEEMNVVDVRLIDYGRGEGILAAAIRSQIADIPEVVCVTGITKFRGVFIECVTPLARDIIQKL